MEGLVLRFYAIGHPPHLELPVLPFRVLLDEARGAIAELAHIPLRDANRAIAITVAIDNDGSVLLDDLPYKILDVVRIGDIAFVQKLLVIAQALILVWLCVLPDIEDLAHSASLLSLCLRNEADDERLDRSYDHPEGQSTGDKSREADKE